MSSKSEGNRYTITREDAQPADTLLQVGGLAVLGPFGPILGIGEAKPYRTTVTDRVTGRTTHGESSTSSDEADRNAMDKQRGW